jgi:hypothetical protein
MELPIDGLVSEKLKIFQSDGAAFYSVAMKNVFFKR